MLVQPSSNRVYSDSEYSSAGARITECLSDATTIFGVKQPRHGTIVADKTYCIFSHVVKAQPENMGLLDL